MMNKFKQIGCMLVLFSIVLGADAQSRTIPEAKRKTIDSILLHTGTKNILNLMGRQLSSEILGVLQSKNVPMNEDLIKLVDQEARKVIYEDFVLSNQFNEIFYALYDEHFTAEELREIAAFYESKAGQRLLSAMPEISRRSMEAAQEKSKGIGYKVQQRLMQRFDEAEQKIKSAEEPITK